MAVCDDLSCEQIGQSFVCSEAMVDKGANEWQVLGSDFWTLAVPIDLVASFVNQLKVRGPSFSILPFTHLPLHPQYLFLKIVSAFTQVSQGTGLSLDMSYQLSRAFIMLSDFQGPQPAGSGGRVPCEPVLINRKLWVDHLIHTPTAWTADCGLLTGMNRAI